MQEALGYMRRGALVPDSTVWEMVRERVRCLRCGEGFILDGFPRTLGQAESLKQLLDSEKLALTAVVNYELPTREIIARLGGRRTCEKCKAVFHVIERPPKVAARCDHCGGTLFQREDDRPESIQVRLEAYGRSTAPLNDGRRSWRPDAFKIDPPVEGSVRKGHRSTPGDWMAPPSSGPRFPHSVLIPALSVAYVDHPGTFR
jgi:adenylate kinase family enzyme